MPADDIFRPHPCSASSKARSFRSKRADEFGPRTRAGSPGRPRRWARRETRAAARGFAGAVGSQHGEDLAPGLRQRGVAQGDGGAETRRPMVGLDDGAIVGWVVVDLHSRSLPRQDDDGRYGRVESFSWIVDA